MYIKLVPTILLNFIGLRLAYCWFIARDTPRASSDTQITTDISLRTTTVYQSASKYWLVDVDNSNTLYSLRSLSVLFRDWTQQDKVRAPIGPLSHQSFKGAGSVSATEELLRHRKGDLGQQHLKNCDWIFFETLVSYWATKADKLKRQLPFLSRNPLLLRCIVVLRYDWLLQFHFLYFSFLYWLWTRVTSHSHTPSQQCAKLTKLYTNYFL